KLIVTLILLFILMPSVRAQFSGAQTETANTTTVPSTQEATAQTDAATPVDTAPTETLPTDEPALNSPDQPSTETESEPGAPTGTAAVTIPTIDLPSAELFTGSVTLLGTGEPETDIEVLLNGNPFVRTTIDTGGLWSATGTIDEPGNYEVVVNALDAAGNVVASSNPVTIPIVGLGDEVLPPTFDAPIAELTSGELTLSGTGQPGSIIEIMLDGKVIGTAAVDENGFWAWAGTIDEAGDYQVVINALDSSGNIIASSEPAPLTITAAEILVPELISPQAGDSLQAGPQTLRGTGEPETELEFLIDGETLGTTTVRDNGAWSFSEDIDEPGEIELIINVLDSEGEVVAATDPVTLVITQPEEEEPAETEIIDETGFACQEDYIVVADDWLSKLSDKYYSDLFLYPAIVTATNEKHAIDDTFAEIENPDVIEPGWKLCIVAAEVAESLTEEEN
ncbi:MAG: hypothetical protein KDJ52_09050, partial [Anaerolineae bacterium]|nr:hypothetical protein [Anaerolineae bacterium]